MNPFSLRFQSPQNMAAMDIWLFKEDGEAMKVAAPMKLIWADAGSRSEAFPLPDPSLRLPWSIWSRLFELVPEALAHAKGVSPEQMRQEVGPSAAEFKALNAHLGDMREIAMRALGGSSTQVRSINRREIDAAFDRLRSAGVCQNGILAVRDLLKALGLEGV